MANIDEDRVRRIAELVERVGRIPDLESRHTAHALMESVLEYHGAGLERLLEILFDSGEAGQTAIRRLAGDGLVSSLLVLHGLHPDDLETRVQQAIGKLGGKAELVGVFEGVVRVRALGDGCGLKESIEATLREAVPDASEVIVEQGSALHGFVPLASLVGA